MKLVSQLLVVLVQAAVVGLSCLTGQPPLMYSTLKVMYAKPLQELRPVIPVRALWTRRHQFPSASSSYYSEDEGMFI